MALSQLAILNAKRKDKPYLLLDGEGLHLQIYTSGSKLWRLRYRFSGKANMMSLGAFPAVSLKEARDKRGEIKKQIAAGINPSLRRKLDKISASSANSFGAVADEYLANLKANGAAEITVSKNRWLLEDLAAPIRNRPVNEVFPAADLLKEALATASRIARNAPISVRQAKLAVHRGLQSSLRDGLALEIEAYNRMVPTEDRREGVLAFNEKRPPNFKGK